MLVKPPSLGPVEVALHQLKKNLWVHVGVETAVVEQVRSLFPLLQERLAGQDWEQLRFTVGKVRLLSDFFGAEEPAAPASSQKTGRIDLRV